MDLSESRVRCIPWLSRPYIMCMRWEFPIWREPMCHVCTVGRSRWISPTLLCSECSTLPACNTKFQKKGVSGLFFLLFFPRSYFSLSSSFAAVSLTPPLLRGRFHPLYFWQMTLQAYSRFVWMQPQFSQAQAGAWKLTGAKWFSLVFLWGSR